MTCTKKGTGQAEDREKNVEQLTDEKLAEVSGGTGEKCAPDRCLPTMVECEPQHTTPCTPLRPPWWPK